MDGDATDGLANNQGQLIDIYHVTTGKSLSFKAFVTAFSDQYSADYNSESVYGRMDPILTYKGTTRKISLGWEVPAASFLEARQNLEKASLLLSMLYPEYENASGGASTMSTPPMFRLKFLNLITNSTITDDGNTIAEFGGLLGTFSGFTFEPDLEAGFFQPHDVSATKDEDTKLEANFNSVINNFFGKKTTNGVKLGDRGQLFPKMIKFQGEFTVLHEHKLGFNRGRDGLNRKGFEKFPYNKKHFNDPDPKLNVASGNSDKEVRNPDGSKNKKQTQQVNNQQNNKSFKDRNNQAAEKNMSG
jgi:hypothetical protein